MVRFKCPKCSAILNAEESLRGQVSQCGACGQPLRIPPLGAPSPSVPSVEPNSVSQAITADAPLGAPGNVFRLAAEQRESRPTSFPSAEISPSQLKRLRRKPKRRPKRPVPTWKDHVWYYAVAIGPFGWMLIGLMALWAGTVVSALVAPGPYYWMPLLGYAMVVFANLWITFIAFRDNHVYGTLCFFTFLFSYVYIVMNWEETSKPAALAGIGWLFTFTGLLLPHLLDAGPVPAT